MQHICNVIQGQQSCLARLSLPAMILILARHLLCGLGRSVMRDRAYQYDSNTGSKVVNRVLRLSVARVQARSMLRQHWTVTKALPDTNGTGTYSITWIGRLLLHQGGLGPAVLPAVTCLRLILTQLQLLPATSSLADRPVRVAGAAGDIVPGDNPSIGASHGDPTHPP